MTGTGDHAAFLRAVCDRPDDDLPRLVYADWLGDHGGPERAEFIRVQVELAKRIGDGKRCPVCDWPIREDGSGCTVESCCFRPGEHTSEHRGWLKRQTEYHALRGRERDLLLKHGGWFDRKLVPYINDDGRVSTGQLGQASGPSVFHTFRRGFVTEVECTWEHWQAHADALLSAAPIRRVRRERACVCVNYDGLRSDPPGVEEQLRAEEAADASTLSGSWHPCEDCNGTGRVDVWVGDGLVRLTVPPTDDECIEHGAEVLAGRPSVWTFRTWPGVEFELPAAAVDLESALAYRTTQNVITDVARSVGIPPDLAGASGVANYSGRMVAIAEWRRRAGV